MDVTPAALLTSREVAKMLQISERKLWGITDQGQLPCIWFGRAKRYDRQDVLRMIDQLKGVQRGQLDQ